MVINSRNEVYLTKPIKVALIVILSFVAQKNDKMTLI